jgi:hypothetical protein
MERIPDKLAGLQLVKKYPTFYGTRRFITAFTSARHLSLVWTRSIQSMLSHPTSWRSILILSSHLRIGVPSGLFASGLSTETLCAPLLSPVRATCPSHLILQTYNIIVEEPWIFYENWTLYFHWSFILEYYMNVNEKGPVLLKGIYCVVDLSRVILWHCVPFSCYLPSNGVQGWPCALNLDGLGRKWYSNRAFSWRDLRLTHMPCRAHAVPLPCHAALIYTCHAALLSFSDSAVSFVKVRVVAGNIRTASPTV